MLPIKKAGHIVKLYSIYISESFTILYCQAFFFLTLEQDTIRSQLDSFLVPFARPSEVIETSINLVLHDSLKQSQMITLRACYLQLGDY